MIPSSECDWCKRPSYGMCPTCRFFKTYREMYRFADRHPECLDIDHNVLIYEKVKEVMEKRQQNRGKRKKVFKDFMLTISALETKIPNGMKEVYRDGEMVGYTKPEWGKGASARIIKPAISSSEKKALQDFLKSCTSTIVHVQVVTSPKGEVTIFN